MTDQLTLLKAVSFLAGNRKFEPHQIEAFQNAWDGMSPQVQAEFAATWKGKPKNPDPAKPSPSAAVAAQGSSILLDVPYYGQRDSAIGQGERMCFSSTCAMAAAFLKPGCLAGSGQPDDRYLAIVERFGDTTAAEAQVKALGTLGVRARFRQDGDMDDLVAELRAGRPVPVGWLHKGPVSAPSGGGHWTLAIGWLPASRQVTMHDPYGEASLVGGGYVTTAVGSGRARCYSEGNWGKRWMVDGPGSGWWLQLSV